MSKRRNWRDTAKPPKFIDLTGDDCCPHEEAGTKYLRVRVFCDAIKYDGKCYSACGCGKIVLDVMEKDAWAWVNAGCAEWVADGVPVSEPGHEECEDSKGAAAPIAPVIEPVVKPQGKAVDPIKGEADPVLKPPAPVTPAAKA